MKLPFAGIVLLAALVFSAQSHAAAPPTVSKQPSFIPGDIVVKFKDNADRSAQSTSYPASGQTLKYEQAVGYGAELWKIDTAQPAAATLTKSTLAQRTAAAIRALESDPRVEYAHVNPIVHLYATPYDPLYPQQWNYSAINLPAAWDAFGSVKGNVIVGIIDTGRLDHPDLAGKWLPGHDFTTSSGGSNAYDDTDTWHHGLHVAGIVAANASFTNPNNLTGGAGICPDCRILPIKYIPRVDEWPSGDVAFTWLPEALNWAVANGARVVNMSFGTGDPNQYDPDDPVYHGRFPCSRFPELQAAINDAVAKGTVVVAAAGNWAANTADISPASCNGVIAVAASDPNNQLAAYSDRGTRIDVTAPGGGGNMNDGSYMGAGVGCTASPVSWDPYQGTVGVLSSWAVEKPMAQLTLDQVTGNNDYCYRYLSGTSMAAPHVVGVAALMLSRNPTLTPAQVLQRLKATAHPVAGCGNQCGAGLIDAGAAVAGVPAPSATFAITPGMLTVPLSASSANFQVDWNAPGYTGLDWWGSVNGSTPSFGVLTGAAGSTVQPLAADTTYQYWIYPQGTTSPLLSRASISGQHMVYIAEPSTIIVPPGATQGQVVISWRAAEYAVVDWISSINGGPRRTPVTTPGTGYTVQPMQPGNTYEIWVYPAGNQTTLLAHQIITAHY